MAHARSSPDEWWGGSASEEIHGGNRSDELHGGQGDDTLWGDNGADGLWGDDGADQLHGGNGRDDLHGGSGDDTLFGDNGDDDLAGDAGRDRIVGGRGDDRMWGGAGSDIFVITSRADGDDTILDWNDGRDGIDLSALINGHAAADLTLDDSSVAGATILRIGGTGVSLTVLGASRDDFDLSQLAATGMVWSRPEGPVVLEEMPAYNWYHGCTATAAGMLFGYWDLHYYSGFFDAEGWDQVVLTVNVQDEISSPAHNAKYDSLPDDPNLPDPPDTSIADFLHTSEGGLGYGGTWLFNVDPGIEGYSAYRGHPLDSQTLGFGSVTWEDVTQEIDDGRPMLFHVDGGGDGFVDHSIAVVGYEDRGDDGLWYGCYTTWREDETLEWFRFRPAAPGNGFGVYSITFVHEPDAVLMASSLSLLQDNSILCADPSAGYALIA